MAHGGAQAGDKLSGTVARRVLGSLYYSLESVGNSHRLCKLCVFVYVLGKQKEEEQPWVGSLHSISLVLKEHGHSDHLLYLTVYIC